MKYVLHIGLVLKGFCNGHFGRDSYEDKRVEAIGADWLVAREVESGNVVFASGADSLEKLLKTYTDVKVAEFHEQAREGGHMNECCQTTYNENQQAEICVSCHCLLPEGMRT